MLPNLPTGPILILASPIISNIRTAILELPGMHLTRKFGL